jgi:hypothetical protein
VGALFCLPAKSSSSEKPVLSLRKPASCVDVDCRSKGCRPKSFETKEEANDCDSCDEINWINGTENETDESSLEETIDILNTVVIGVDASSPDLPKRVRKLTPKQERIKTSAQVKDASALKSFAYGNYYLLSLLFNNYF